MTAKFLQSDYLTQTGTTYPLAIDADINVAARIITNFSPRAQDTPNMTVYLGAGYILIDATIVNVAAQSTGTITAPITNPRYDLVYVDRLTGAVGVVTGTEALSPTDPTLPAGKTPIARVRLATTTTSINNTLIDDLRDLGSLGKRTLAFLGVGTGISSNGTNLNVDPSGVSASTTPTLTDVFLGYAASLYKMTYANMLKVINLLTEDTTPDSANDFLIEYDASAGDVKKVHPAKFSVPTGTLLDFAGTAAPTGFLGCDGSAVSRTTYSSLFAVIGTTWGIGDGSTTFNLPDFRRRTAVGSGGTGTATLGNSVGNTGGEETHALTAGENGPHAHGVLEATSGVANSVVVSSNGSSATISTNISGSGTPHNNIQPSAIVLKIIKI